MLFTYQVPGHARPFYQAFIRTSRRGRGHGRGPAVRDATAATAARVDAVLASVLQQVQTAVNELVGESC